MPVYNGERYLEAAIRSNLDQTYSDLELVISDNGSTDATEAICRRFAAADSRVKYTRNERNIGAAANYNKLFHLARGEYFRWSNADDIAAPQLIELTLPVLASRDDVVIAFGRTTFIDADGKELGMYNDGLDLQDDRPSTRYMKFFENVGLTNIVYGLMRKSAVADTDLMGDGQLPAGDVNFMAAMVLLGKFVEIPEVLFYRRMHAEAFSALEDSGDRTQFWKASGSAVALPHLRGFLADARAVSRAPAAAAEKLKLLAFVAKRMYWDRADVANDIVDLFRHRQGT